MDQVRQIRFIIAPFFFLGNLLLGAWLGNLFSIEVVAKWQPQTVVAIGGVLVAALLPLGFLIGGISVLFLRTVFCVISKGHYEVSLSDDTWQRIWPALKANVQRTRSNELYSGVTFDHEILHDGIHDWLVRRWNAFNISVNSCTAVVLAHLVGFALAIPLTRWWVGTTACLFGLFVFIAFVSWRETMGMVDFQSHRIQDGRMPHETAANEQAPNR